MPVLNLALHCGSHVATRDEIHSIVTPEGTDTHRPLSHISLIARIERAAEKAAFEIVSSAYAMNRGGDHMFALMQLGLDTDSDTDTGLVIGVRNSHNKQFSAGIVAGNGVFVCDNLSFNGEMKLMRRHTKNIEYSIGDIVCRAIEFVMRQRISHDARVKAYKDRKLTDREVSALITILHEEKVINVSRSHVALREWISPSHSEFMEDGASVWRLYNAFTECIKGSSIWHVPSTTEAIHEVLDNIDTVLGERLHMN